MNALRSLRQHARKLPKAVFWVMTPWRMPMRLQFLRDRAARKSRAQTLLLLIEGERLRLEALRDGQSATFVESLDLCDTAKALEAAGLSEEQAFWPPVEARDVRDQTSAARFLLDTLRHRGDLRSRFPFLLSAPLNRGFVDWLSGIEGRTDLGLTSEAVEHLVSLLSKDFGARARQLFLTNEEIRAVLPHGLMPSGRRSLFRWFMQHGLDASDLTREEIWWLFLEAAENPKVELIRAFQFTPAWQRRFPDALTVFGWSRFTAWFVATYGAEEAIAESSWPAPAIAPATQIRLAYFAQPAWSKAHPEALSDAAAARALLEWLVSSGQAHADAETRRWCAELDVEALVPDLSNGGANIIGHFCYPSGLRVSVIAMTEALKLAGVRHPCGTSERMLMTIRITRASMAWRRATSRSSTCSQSPFLQRPTLGQTWQSVSHAPIVLPTGIGSSTRSPSPGSSSCQTGRRSLDGHGIHRARACASGCPFPVRTLFPGVALAPYPSRERAVLRA